jgi:phosphate transport system substrate-binding protein
MQRNKWTRTMLVLILTLPIMVTWLAGCSTPEPVTETTAAVHDESGQITFAGSTTVQPLAAELAQAFNTQYPNVTLDIAAGGSSVGINAIHDGTVDIGMASRKLSDAEAEGIEVHQIAVDVIAIVVNEENPIENLDYDQLRAIYRGEITNWSEVGGEDVDILVAIRETTSGTRKAFDDLVLDKEEPTAPNMAALMTAGDVAAKVSGQTNAIGYVGFGNLEAGIKAIHIDGVEPTEDNARNGSYSLTRPLQLLTGPLTQPLAKTFIDYAVSDAGQDVVQASGWIPAN